MIPDTIQPRAVCAAAHPVHAPEFTSFGPTPESTPAVPSTPCISRAGAALCVAAALAASLASSGMRAALADDLNQQYQDTIRPLFAKYCFDCHGSDTAEGDLQLDSFASAAQVRDQRERWLKVQGQLRAESMPPEDADQPTAQQRAQLLEWIDLTINKADCDGPVNPGHVTLRRLNRIEYRHTIRDLLAVDYQPADDFPADDVGYGFDNIGDVLSLPPLLMEKYLAAAQQVSQQAIVTPSVPALDRSVPGRDLQGAGSATAEARALSTSGEVFLELEMPTAGSYRLWIRAAGDQAGDEPVRIAFRVDGRDVVEQPVRATRSEPGEYSARINIPAGSHKIGVAFLNDYYVPAKDGQPGQDRNFFLGALRVTGPLDVDDSKLSPQHRRIFVVQPGEQLSEREAARQILQPLAARTFRRDVAPAEVERLLPLVDLAIAHGDSFEAGIQLALQTLLVSPHFLFRVEQNPAEDQESRALDDFELATRLSYFLWSSMPDEELFQLARAGQLRQDDQLTGQVRRMLADPKADAFIENFAGQWLQLRSLEDLQFDTERFPHSDAKLLRDMRTETTRFFAEIVRQDLSVLTVLDADFTFVNEALARHYGISGVTGPEFRRVSLAGTPRGGVITHASILAVTSNPTRTSPVKRGKFVLENLLGSPPPAPPANVPLLDDQQQLTGTLRQRLEQHRINPGCASCHKLMDPIGFALEHFDAVGRYRETDDGQPIDPSGELPTGEKFQGFAELRTLLSHSKREQYLQCLAQKVLIYALGRGLEYYDQCAIDEILNALEQDDYRFSRLVLEVVRSDPFQKQGKKRSRE